MPAYERRVRRELRNKAKVGIPTVDKETCPKCGYTASPQIHYCPGKDKYSPRMYPCAPPDPPHEHLHVNCPVCHYDHTKPCRDAQEEPK